MPLKTRIAEDMKTAMRGKDTSRLSVIRMLLAGIKQREIDERKELSDAEVLAVIDKMVKQRNDSIVQFEAGKRADLVAAEKGEIVVLREYQPAQFTQVELEALIADAIRVTAAAGALGIGKVMTALKPQLAGRADLALVSAIVKARLTG
ncbi:MAG: GatB/YqeY domain-containing protein [Betaproteobacteria bacterium]|nr:GatB/YqeY domain-containing protein [Betaproteobacteria bacterium]